MTRLSLFVALLLAWCLLLLASSSALAQSPTAKTPPACKPQPKLSTCPAEPQCAGILRKAYSRGCKSRRGKLFLDGGCQCIGYCGYQCASACRADPECSWNNTKLRCFNTATGLPGKAINICRATGSPTMSPSRTPTKQPTKAPTSAPTLPTRQPTTVPSQSPTKSYCKQDTKFAKMISSFRNPHTLGMAASGKAVLVSNHTYFESEVKYDVWAALKSSNGNWNMQLVQSYDWDDYYGSLEPNAAISGDGKSILTVSYSDKSLNRNVILTFFRRDSKNKFQKQQALSTTVQYAERVWVSTNGARAGLCFGTTNTSTHRYSPSTMNLVQKNGKWSVEFVQDGIWFNSVSRNGNTALMIEMKNEPIQYVYRHIYVRQGAQWILQTDDIVGSGLPRAQYYQGTSWSTFSTDGNSFVLGANVLHEDDYSPDFGIPEDSGAWVFTRSANGSWIQAGPKLGGGNLFDGPATGISDNLKTVMISNVKKPFGFKIFRKSGSTWVQAGSKVITDAVGPMLSADGVTVVTITPASVWTC